MVGCVQSVMGKNEFIVLFEDIQQKDIGSCLFVYLNEKDEVEKEDSITLFPEIEEGVPLTINGDPPDGEPCMFVNGMYLFLFNCLWYHTNLTTEYSEEQVVEERDPDLNKIEDIRFDKIWEDHWRDLAEESNDKNKIHALRWCVYVKNKEDLIKISFFVSVPHPKGGKIVWTCEKDHVI